MGHSQDQPIVFDSQYYLICVILPRVPSFGAITVTRKGKFDFLHDLDQINPNATRSFSRLSLTRTTIICPSFASALFIMSTDLTDPKNS